MISYIPSLFPLSSSHITGKLTLKLLQPLLQPLKVLLQFLQRIQHSSIRPQSVLAHDLLQRDQIPDVQRTRV